MPDVMSIAKGLGSGFPIGAVLATTEAAKGMTPGTHGSTFGGNHLATTVADAVLETILEDGFLANVSAVSEVLRQQLEELCGRHPTVFKSVRGAGLMLGIECISLNLDLMSMAQEEGLLTVVAGENVLRLVPPLIIEEHHVEEAIEILNKVAERGALVND